NPYTQSHKDTNDVQGGVAGLITLGEYTNGHLCVPELGLKVSYTPGTTALIRGDALSHYVDDYTGQRRFIVGTVHQSLKLHAWRKLGRLRPLDPKQPNVEDKAKERDWCVNDGEDDDEDRGLWPNKELHGPGALDYYDDWYDDHPDEAMRDRGQEWMDRHK
ncbi:hypothetical protein B0O99DRAFT_525033, partial [Bisporella sp. PMI_857]